MKKRFSYLLVLLLTMVTQGTWAKWTGGTYTASANETLDAITVNGDAMLIINDGVTVTVNGGIKVTSGTLTIVGHGTLVVNGKNGNKGAFGTNGYGGNGDTGGTAISGNIIVKGATVNANGGAGGIGGDTFYGYYAGDGGTGGAAFSGAVTIYSGTITAAAGNGGNGGHNDGEMYGGSGGTGGIAFTGTLTYYGGTVNANGGAGGNKGTGTVINYDGVNGNAGKAFANSVNFQKTPTTLTNGSSTISQSEVTNHTTVNISGSGVAQQLPPTDNTGTYLISSTYDWITFADAVNTGTTTFSGKTVKLTANISDVTTMVGTGDYPFAGTFDGDGHKLTVNISSSGAAALFIKVGNVTIKNLHVAGSVKTTMTNGADHTGGLISRAGGSVTIENVRFSATVTGLTYYSGFIGNGNRDDVSIGTTIKMTGCVFDGQLTENVAGETQYAGGFIGWGGNMTITMTDCLFAGTSTIAASGSGARNFHPVGFHGTYNTSLGSLTLNNVYTTAPSATQAFPNFGAALSSGEKQAYSITAADANVTTLAISGNAVANYTVSGLKRYAAGIEYGSTFYAGNGESVNLTLSHAAAAAGQHFTGYAVSGGGSLTAQTETSATLTMSDADQTVSAEYADNPSHIVTLAISTEPGWSVEPSGIVREGETVTVSYQGDHKVKSVAANALSGTVGPVTITGTKTGDNTYSGTFTMPAADVGISTDLYYKLSAEVSLQENLYFNGVHQNFYLDRTLTKDVWNTFASPFAIPSEKMEEYFGPGAKVCTFSSSTMEEDNVLCLHFVNATEIKVGSPYIVKPTVNVVEPTFDDANFYNAYMNDVSDTYVCFTPTLGRYELTSYVRDFLIMSNEGKFVHPSTPGTIKGYRCFFMLYGGAKDARAFRVNFGDGETTTGLINVNGNDNDNDNGSWYDLQGRMVTQPTKGIYIRRSAEGRLQGKNGRKVIIK